VPNASGSIRGVATPRARSGARAAWSRLTEARARLGRSIAVWLEQARASLGIRRGFHADGADVYYKELSAERLARALAARTGKRGRGYKDYRVTFPDGFKLFIRCTRSRCYADVMGADGLHRYERIGSIVRPGSRVLEVAAEPMTTGYSAEWLSRMVGASGAVVSVTSDEESARFAVRRYALPNLSIEHARMPGDEPGAGPSLGDILAGETDSAFDSVLALALPEDGAARDAMMREVWRVLRPGGWMLAGIRGVEDGRDPRSVSLKSVLASRGQIIDPAEGVVPGGPPGEVLVRKPQGEVEVKG
jgi:hypothetical protein